MVVAVTALVVLTAAGCAPLKGGGQRNRVMLVGDSVAHSVTPELAWSFGARGWAFEPAAQQGCGVVRGVIADLLGVPLFWAHACEGAIWNMHEYRVDTFRPSVVLWFGYLEEWPRHVDGGVYSPGPWAVPSAITGQPADEKILALIEEKWAQFTRYGAKVVFVTMPPPATEHAERAAHLNNNLLKRFVLEHPGSTALIDLAAMACPPTGTPPCPTVVDGIELRPDSVHFSPAGAGWVAEHVVPHL